MIYKILSPKEPVISSITLPASKSISNRLLVMHALSDNQDSISNLSDSDDTLLMQKALLSSDHLKDIGHGGTAMRFLTAYYSCSEGSVIMTGSERMKERPIGPLVEALRKLGASIEYLGEAECPPLQIEGRELEGGEIGIAGNVSSQFISALIMIAPYLKKGLRLHLEGEVVSSSYIKMTLELMRHHGAEYIWEGDTISIEPGRYQKENFTVESDWSAASYWYAMMLANRKNRLQLCHLSKDSLQGDIALVDIFQKLGVQTAFNGNCCELSPSDPDKALLFEYDFSNSPDIVQSMAVILCMASIPFRFSGTRTLRIKETDRISALQNEMKKLGFILKSNGDGDFLAWNGDRCPPQSEPVINTYHDHRMAMAFVPVALFFNEIRIGDPMVVTKSYPVFWEHLRSAGFQIEEVL